MDQDMFMCYAGIGVGHDAVQLWRHVHGLVDDHLAADSEEEGDEELEESSSYRQASQNNSLHGCPWWRRWLDDHDQSKAKGGKMMGMDLAVIVAEDH